MKQSLCSIFFLVFLAHCSFSQQQAEAVIRNMENLERKAILEKDTVQLHKLMSRNLIVQNPENNIVSFRQVIDRIKDGKINYISFDRRIDHVSIIDNLAVVMGLETIIPRGDSPNAGKTINRRFTNIWTIENGEWKLTARQATIVPAD